MNPLKKYIAFLFVGLLSGCSLRKTHKIYIATPSLSGASIQLEAVKSARPNITIFIHGTSQIINSLRFIPLLGNFVAKHGRTPEGLLRYDELPENHGFRQCADELHVSSPTQFQPAHCYFFGWSGKLSPRERKKGAYGLYAAIKRLQEKPEYKDAEFTLITHSHGGNVALYLAQVAEENNDQTLRIKRLILGGCPIQDETECYAGSSVFENVYNLYSVVDLIQVGDPQGLQHQHTKDKKTVFSRKEINIEKPHGRIIQAAISIDGYPLYHIDFIRPFFHKELPFILDLLDHESMYNKLPKINDYSYQVNLLTYKSWRYRVSGNRIISLD